MLRRKLGTRDVELSELALGTWGVAAGSYGPLPDAATGRGAGDVLKDLVLRALEGGVTTFDLAPLWGDGLAETVVGEAIRGRRSDVSLVTRAGAGWKRGRAVSRFEPYDLIGDLEASLKRLGTDHVDVWLLHNPPEHVMQRDDWARTAVRLKEDGKIRAWGVSVGDDKQAKQALAAGADALCLVYNLLNSEDLHVLTSELKSRGAGVIVRSPLAYGLLAGKWKEGQSFPQGDHRANRWSAHALRTRLRQTENLRFLVDGTVPSMTAAALRYVLANQLVTTAAVGARSLTQLEEALSGVGEAPYLSPAQLERIPAAIVAGVR